MEDLKKQIIEMLNGIEDEKFLRAIYIILQYKFYKNS